MPEGKVLVVDDERLNRLILSTSLQALGYIVEAVEDGMQALALLREQPYDVVLLDLLMPGLDGFQLLQQIKEDPALRHLPVIVISASQEMESTIRCIELGAADFLPKPFNPVLLRARLSASMAMKRLHDAERAHVEALEAHNAELDAFTHTVAHDLKQPLSIVVGYGEMLLGDYADYSDDYRQEVLAQIVDVGYRMNRIIQELLLLASVRKQQVEMVPFDMEPRVRAALGRLSFVIFEQQPTITVAEAWPTALGYGPWIEEVWTNYLSNALKYGGSPANIELGWTPCARWGRFWVRDYGAGISPKQQGELFIPFNRLDQLRIEGQGLGLSIVQRIVAKMGGQVGVESAVGEGSTFWFELPLAKDGA